MFFSRSAGGEPINKTADERDEEQRGKSERKSDLSLTNFQRLPNRPTDRLRDQDGVTSLGCAFGWERERGKDLCPARTKLSGILFD